MLTNIQTGGGGSTGLQSPSLADGAHHHYPVKRRKAQVGASKLGVIEIEEGTRDLEMGMAGIGDSHRL